MKAGMAPAPVLAARSGLRRGVIALPPRHALKRLRRKTVGGLRKWPCH